MSELKTIGFIGLGNMGAPMARNLLSAGYRLVVHDIRREAGQALVSAGAEWADDARGVGAASDAVLVALPGPEEVAAAVEGPAGVLAGARPGTYIIDVSTSTPECVRMLAEQASRRGVRVVDAPLSGGVRGARKGTLTIMVGGSEKDFNACLPLFRVLGEQVIHVGPIGSGHVTKLVNNLMGIGNAILSMEAVAMGVAAGVQPTRLLQVVNLGTGASHMTRTLYPFLILNRNFEPVRFSMELAIKDVRLALGLAEEMGLMPTVGRAVHSALKVAADEHGLGEADMSTYITVLEQQTGVEVSNAPVPSDHDTTESDR